LFIVADDVFNNIIIRLIADLGYSILLHLYQNIMRKTKLLLDSVVFNIGKV